MYYPEEMKGRVSPVQSIEPHRILAPTRDLKRECDFEIFLNDIFASRRYIPVVKQN